MTTKVLGVRLTEDERVAIDAAATADGISAASWVRRIAVVATTGQVVTGEPGFGQVVTGRLRDDQLAWVDAQCEQRQMSRSDFFRFVIDRAMAGQGARPATPSATTGGIESLSAAPAPKRFAGPFPKRPEKRGKG